MRRTAGLAAKPSGRQRDLMILGGNIYQAKNGVTVFRKAFVGRGHSNWTLRGHTRENQIPTDFGATPVGVSAWAIAGV